MNRSFLDFLINFIIFTHWLSIKRIVTTVDNKLVTIAVIITVMLLPLPLI